MDDVLSLRRDLQGLANRVAALEAKLKPAPMSEGGLDFDMFWTIYPRKVNKVDASRAWARLTVSDKLAALDAVVRYNNVWKQAAPDRLPFIKHPATWLRARAWEDGEAEWRKVAHLDRPTTTTRALVGSHAPGNHHPLDLDLAPPDVKAIALKWRAKEPTTEEEDARYLAWEASVR